MATFKTLPHKARKAWENGATEAAGEENPLLDIETECSQLLAPKCLIEFERTVKYHSQNQLSLKDGKLQ